MGTIGSCMGTFSRSPRVGEALMTTSSPRIEFGSVLGRGLGLRRRGGGCGR